MKRSAVLQFCLSWIITPPYGHLGNTVTSLLRLLFWPPGKNDHIFLVKKLSLIRSLRYYSHFLGGGPLTGFHCKNCLKIIIVKSTVIKIYNLKYSIKSFLTKICLQPFLKNVSRRARFYVRRQRTPKSWCANRKGSISVSSKIERGLRLYYLFKPNIL